MRPRKDGTLSIVPAPGTAARACSNSGIWFDWISTKKKAGASFGIRWVIWSRRLPSINAVATSTVRPSPRDNMTMGVGAPGRCRLAIASLSAANLGLGTRAANAISPRASSGKAMNAPIVPSTNQPVLRRSLAVSTVKLASTKAVKASRAMSRQPSRTRVTSAPRIRLAAETARARMSGNSANSSDTRKPNAAAMASGLK